MKTLSAVAIGVACSVFVCGVTAVGLWSSVFPRSSVFPWPSEQELQEEIRDLELQIKIVQLEGQLEQANRGLEALNEKLEGKFEDLHEHFESSQDCAPGDLDIEELRLMCAELDELGYVPDC